MTKLTLTTLAMAMAASTFANAAYIDLGVEQEYYNDDFKNSDNVMPYLGAGFKPSADSSLAFSFKFSDKQTIASTKHAEDANGLFGFSSDRGRQDYAVSYTYNVSDAFTIMPKLTIRHDNFSFNDTHATEYRMHPNMSYKMNDMITLAFDGFVAPVKLKSTDPKDKANRKSTSDLKHEADFRVNMTFNDTQSARVSLYNEAAKLEAKDSTVNEWQLRLVYAHKFADLTVSPYARIDLSRDLTVANNSVAPIRHRAGVNGKYNLGNDFAVVFDVNYQAEKTFNVTTETRGVNKSRMFYNIAINYTF